MRLRHIKAADPALEESVFCIKDPELKKGRWDEVFEEPLERRMGASGEHSSSTGSSTEGKDAKPIELEIGSGKGRFLIEKSLQNPETNYIGMERYSSVLYRAIQKMDEMDEEFENLRWIRGDARNLPELFDPGEIQKIYLNFSDPWPKKRHADRRLTSGRYLLIYGSLLLPGSTIEFKTDNQDLFTFSLESIEGSEQFDVIRYTRDLYRDPELNAGNVKTEYEERFAGEGKPICKLIAVRK